MSDTTKKLITDIENGVYIKGTFLGYTQTPWPTAPDKFNYRIGIKSREYEGQFGQTESEVIAVDVLVDDRSFFASKQTELMNKEIIIPVVFRARKGGAQGAFLAQFLPKGARPIVLSQ